MLTKIRTYRYAALLWIGVVLLGLIGPNLSAHFCGGHLSGIGLVSFQIEDDQNPGKCCHENDCCEDVNVEVDVEIQGVSSAQVIEDKTQPQNDINIVTQQIPVWELSRTSLDNTPIYQAPPPKLSGTEIRVWYQSFLC